MRHRKRAIGLHEDASCLRSFGAFLAERGVMAAIRRTMEIGELPTVEWRGRTLYRLRCDADFGRGPHIHNVPESLLWALIDLRRFRCAYHR